jgi:preprotein translocase subunit SecG
MLGFFIGLLTVVLVLDCVFLVLLVLVQLPKKEAGMGQAFGGAATDALFGAGSGNALTKMTKWAAGIFFVLAVVLTIMSNYSASRARTSKLPTLLKNVPAATPPPAATATPPTATPPPAIKLETPAAPTTTVPPAAPTTNIPGATAPASAPGAVVPAPAAPAK